MTQPTPNTVMEQLPLPSMIQRLHMIMDHYKISRRRDLARLTQPTKRPISPP